MWLALGHQGNPPRLKCGKMGSLLIIAVTFTLKEKMKSIQTTALSGSKSFNTFNKKFIKAVMYQTE